MSHNITACIDGSDHAMAVCDAAAWAAHRLAAPLTFVHVIDNHAPSGESDVSGRIGLGTREHLLEELAELEEKRGRLAQQNGRMMLEAACERARADGVDAPAMRQRNGELVDTLVEIEESIRLLVLGKRGERAASTHDHLGSNLERAIRSLHCPVLITPAVFAAPERILVAFDGSETAHRMVDRIAASALFRGVDCHLVMVGEAGASVRGALQAAETRLAAAVGRVTTTVLTGEVEASLRRYAQASGIDLIVMGAYGHSRIRHLLVGSTTSAMIRYAHVPLLILR